MASGTSRRENVGQRTFFLDKQASHEDVLRRMRTAGSISIPPELFEKLYLAPQTRVSGHLRSTFGNPTPLGMIGILLCLQPLSMELMDWRGTGGAGLGSANIGNFMFFGGMLLIFSAVGEWILGNTFPFVIFGTLSAFFFTFGATLQPSYGAYAAYAPVGEPASAGLAQPAFLNSLAFTFITMGILGVFLLILALRVNLVFLILFVFLEGIFGTLSATYMYNAQANTKAAHRCQVTAGALAFAASMLVWYLFFAIMLAIMDFPFQLPVGDLSHMIEGASEKQKRLAGEV